MKDKDKDKPVAEQAPGDTAAPEKKAQSTPAPKADRPGAENLERHTVTVIE